MNAIKNLKSKLGRNKKEDPTKVPIDTPQDFDILLGRGKTSFNHVGNRRFRVFIGLHLRRYMDASSRMEKTLVVNGVVEAIQEAGGRFLKQDSKTEKWFQVTPKMAREKVGHALRDAVGMRLKLAASGQAVSEEGEAAVLPVFGRRGSGAVRRGSASEVAIARTRRASNVDIVRPSLLTSHAAGGDDDPSRFSRSCNDLTSSMASDARRALLELGGLDDDDDQVSLPLVGGSSELLFQKKEVPMAPPNNTDETPRMGSGKKVPQKKGIVPLPKSPSGPVPGGTGGDQKIWDGGSAEFSVMSEATAKKWGFDPGSAEFSVATVDSKVFDDTEPDDPALPKHLMDKVNKRLTVMESNGELVSSSKHKKGGPGLFRRKNNSSKKLGKFKNSNTSMLTDVDLSEEFSIMSLDTRGKLENEIDFGLKSEEFGLNPHEFVKGGNNSGGLKSEEFGLRSEEFMKDRFPQTTVEFDAGVTSSRNNSLVSAMRGSAGTLEIDPLDLTPSRSNSLVSAMRGSSTEFTFKVNDFDKLRAHGASDMDKLRNSHFSLGSEMRLSSNEFTLSKIDEQVHATSDVLMRGNSKSKITWSDDVQPKSGILMDTVDEGAGSDDNNDLATSKDEKDAKKGDDAVAASNSGSPP